MPNVETLSLPYRQSTGHGKAAENPSSFGIESAERSQLSPLTVGESFVARGEKIDIATNRVALGRARHFVVRCQMVDETVVPSRSAAAPIAAGT